jgi:hypothetical protein
MLERLRTWGPGMGAASFGTGSGGIIGNDRSGSGGGRQSLTGVKRFRHTSPHSRAGAGDDPAKAMALAVWNL